MSATNRGAQRAPRDLYVTPHWCVRALLQTWTHNLAGKWLDPCAGAGDIIIAAQEQRAGTLWHAQDIVPIWNQLPALGYQQDALAPATLAAWKRQPLDGIITNPPFSIAQQFIEAYRPLATTPAWLLRLNFLGSLRRAAFFRGNMPDVLVLPKRPSFTLDGKTDATEYAWFIWGPQPTEWGAIRIIPEEFCV